MTRKGPARNVDGQYASARPTLARAFLNSARDALDLAETGDIANPAMSQIVNAAIAFCDALTANHAGQVNRKNHAAAIDSLRDALGNRLPAAQITNLRRILEEKDSIQYGTIALRRSDAEALLARLESFASWAESEMRR